MDDRTISMYLARILSGYHRFTYRNKNYKLKYPGIDIKYEAELIAQEEIRSNRFTDWIRTEHTETVLRRQGLWTDEEQEFMDSAESITEKLKINIYQNFRSPSVKHHRNALTQHTNTFTKLYNKRHSLDYVTLEYFCDGLKNQHILVRSIYDEDGNLPLLEDDSELENFTNIINSYGIPIHVFRAVARSGLWSYYWSSKKVGDLFGGPITTWTDEQRVLASLSRMYDGARESPDSPDDDVFNDDDAFDGWTLLQQKKMEEQRKKDKAEKMLPGNLDKATDIFVMARSNEDKELIDSLNDPHGRHIIKERNATIQNIIKEGKEIQHQNLPDVKRDLIIKGTQERIKRRK